MLLGWIWRLDIVVDARNLNHAVGVLELGKQLDQSENSVGRSPSVHAGMQIARRTPSLDFGIDQAAKPDAQRRQSFGEQLGIGHQRDVGLQLGRILRYILSNRLAANFLFTFDQEFEIYRQRAV